ncbi:MAG: hypothetical protein NWE89_11820 [Candidatus Bathyarchaeota archaeon]|nr:hypothetical protein [Candidatus Bathyarchaeota archaeon]
MPQLTRSAGIPRTKGYVAIRRLLEHGLVVELPKVPRPPDWRNYSKGMRKRFYEENGIPGKGAEPTRYRYTPVKALLKARRVLRDRIRKIDGEALCRIQGLLEEFSEVQGALLGG